MWKVKRGDEQSDTFAFHPVAIQVIGYDPSHKVLACAGPAVEGERQWLVGLGVVDETLDGFQDHRLSQVLPMELCLKVLSQTWAEQSIFSHIKYILQNIGCSFQPKIRKHKQTHGVF